MHKRKILYFREPEVHTVLLRQLSRKGYKVFPKVRVEDVIGKDAGEYLSDREFDYMTRSHFDFVVTKDDTALFAVEFDGLHHLQDPPTMERDAIKNRLCKQADLPLLRIMSTEITARDEETLLDYMLSRYVAWQEEIDEIYRETREFADQSDSNADPEDYAVDLDPAFHFDLRHPFPGSKMVRERLWRNYAIAWDLDERSRSSTARYICEVHSGGGGQLQHDQFHTTEAQALLWIAGFSKEKPLYSDKVSATLRAWLPLRPEVHSGRDWFLIHKRGNP